MIVWVYCLLTVLSHPGCPGQKDSADSMSDRVWCRSIEIVMGKRP